MPLKLARSYPRRLPLILAGAGLHAASETIDVGSRKQLFAADQVYVTLAQAFWQLSGGFPGAGRRGTNRAPERPPSGRTHHTADVGT